MSIDRIRQEITAIGRANRAHRAFGASAADNEAGAATCRLIEVIPMFTINTDSEALAVVDALATYLGDTGISKDQFVPKCAANLRTYLNKRLGIATEQPEALIPAMAEAAGVQR